MIYSVVIPVFNEENNVISLYKELKEVLTKLSKEFEMIFVDDGSTDNTLSNLLSIIEQGEKNLQVIHFRQRFGKSSALTAGFQSAKGEIVITLDGDGQDDPNDIPSLIEELKDYDVVCGWRYKRRDSFILKKVPSRIYNFLNRKINRLKIHDSGCALRVYLKEAVEDIILFEGDHRYLPAILQNRGFSITEIKVNHRPRLKGKSKYGLSRIFVGLADLFKIRFLHTHGQHPMRFFFKMGISAIMIALGLGIYLLVMKYAYSQNMSIGLMLLTILLGLGGIQLFFTGFLAELIVRKRITKTELYSVKKVFRYEEKEK
ncbi:MAG: glycosyltransferase family 2 protein [Candidatus Thorarchaeota archaeon]